MTEEQALEYEIDLLERTITLGDRMADKYGKFAVQMEDGTLQHFDFEVFKTDAAPLRARLERLKAKRDAQPQSE